jgi:hypothetical protein
MTGRLVRAGLDDSERMSAADLHIGLTPERWGLREARAG